MSTLTKESIQLGFVCSFRSLVLCHPMGAWHMQTGVGENSTSPSAGSRRREKATGLSLDP